MRTSPNARPQGARRKRDRRDASFFLDTLRRYRELTGRALLKAIPREGPRYLYDLTSDYPRRVSKGLRPALCMATCAALGGNERMALNSAVAIELFHNAFLIHDDVQDESLLRRRSATLHRSHGVGIAVNVGNATNLIALGRVLENRNIVGANSSWQIVGETERMMRNSLEGQAIELAWIRDNVCDLEPADYLQMCLKKTSWYSFIYPLRIGALVATGGPLDADMFSRFGWYLGAAFQIQDDILNLTGSLKAYGKEIGGDLMEGKRTLMLIHLLNSCTARQRARIKRFLSTTRAQRDEDEAGRIYNLMQRHQSIDYARTSAAQLAGAALLEALKAFRDVPDSSHKRFILEMVLYAVRRDR